jgi:hypothetical protein
MFLMSRSARLSGTQGFEWARSMRSLVTETIGHDVQLWARTLSPEFGSVSWTSWWEDLATMEAAFAKLIGDAKYAEATAAGAGFVVGGVDDSLAQSVTDLPAEAGEARYAGSVTATLAVGNAVRGVMSGIEIATRVTQVAGAPSMFVQSLTGPYGGVAWFTAFESLSHYQAAQAKLAAAPDFASYVDSTKGCYIEGSGQSVLWARVD